MAFGFLKKIAKAAGKVAFAPVHLTVKATGDVGKLAGHIPIVGKPLASVIHLATAPVELVDSITRGERIDHAVLNNIKSQVKDVKAVAPYAKMCVSLIPGVGTAVAAGIAAGSALVSGQPITEALMAGIKGAIPGGVLAQSAFSISAGVVSGKGLSSIAIDALPLDSNQKAALTQTVNMAKALASGKSVDKMLLSTLQQQLPPDIRKAVNIGVAVGFAKTHQKEQGTAFAHNPMDEMADIGKAAIEINPILKAGCTTFNNPNDLRGFQIGIGFMHHTVTEAEVSKFQSTVPPLNQNGFNIGLAAAAGLIGFKPTGNNLADFGTITAQGLSGASDELKTKAVTTIASRPEVTKAIVQVAKRNWFQRLLHALHLG